LLADENLNVKHANPAAVQMLKSLPFAAERLAEWLELRFENGQRLVLLVNADYVLVDNETHTLLILQNITVQKMQQEEIAFLAYHDPLTRLPNRRYFHEQLDAALAHARRNGEPWLCC